MSITQSCYDNLASQYDQLFLDWEAATQDQAAILDRLFVNNGYGKSARILDCACGMGTRDCEEVKLAHENTWDKLLQIKTGGAG